MSVGGISPQQYDLNSGGSGPMDPSSQQLDLGYNCGWGPTHHHLYQQGQQTKSLVQPIALGAIAAAAAGLGTLALTHNPELAEKGFSTLASIVDKEPNAKIIQNAKNILGEDYTRNFVKQTEEAAQQAGAGSALQHGSYTESGKMAQNIRDMKYQALHENVVQKDVANKMRVQEEANIKQAFAKKGKAYTDADVEKALSRKAGIFGGSNKVDKWFMKQAEGHLKTPEGQQLLNPDNFRGTSLRGRAAGFLRDQASNFRGRGAIFKASSAGLSAEEALRLQTMQNGLYGSVGKNALIGGLGVMGGGYVLQGLHSLTNPQPDYYYG